MQELDVKIKEFLENLGLEADAELNPHEASLREFYSISDNTPAQTMEKQVSVREFNPKYDRVQIVPISDIHLGSINCNLERFRAFVDYIHRTPDCYTLLTGDLSEMGTKTSIGLGVYEQRYDPETQIDILELELRPLADEGKILGILSGNHEMRVAVATSFQPMKILARNLGVEYLGYQGYHKWVVGEQVYTAMSFHGKSGAQTIGGRINAAVKMNTVANVDIYISGHTHALENTEDIIVEIDTETNQLKYRKRHYVIAGSFLSYWGGYAEMKAYPLSPIGAVRIDLFKDEHRIKIHKP